MSDPTHTFDDVNMLRVPENEGNRVGLVNQRLKDFGLTLHVCDCSFDYNDLLFHIYGHLHENGKACEDEAEVRDGMVQWLVSIPEQAREHAAAWLERKGLSFEEWLEYIATPNNKGDTLSIYFLSRQYQEQTAIIGKTRVFFTHEGPPDSDPNDCGLILVYLGANVFRQAVKISSRPPLLSNPPAKRPKPTGEKDTDYVPPPAAGTSTSTIMTRSRRKGTGTPKAPQKQQQTPGDVPADKKRKKRRGPKPKPKVVVGKLHGLKRRPKRIFNKKCSLCQKLFPSQGLLNAHTRDDHAGYRYYCPDRTCGKNYSAEAALKKHMLSHGSLPYGCDECERRFAYKSELTTHKITHSTEAKYSCRYPRCSSVLKSNYEYRRHYDKHSIPADKFKCPQCKKGFREARLLKQHEVVHTRELRFECAVCKQRFMWSSGLRIHKCGQSKKARKNPKK